MSEIDKSLYADAAEIAAAIGKDKSTVTRMAVDGKWEAVEGKGRGRNKKKWFLIKKLPAEYCAAVMMKRFELREQYEQDCKGNQASAISARNDTEPVVRHRQPVARPQSISGGDADQRGDGGLLQHTMADQENGTGNTKAEEMGLDQAGSMGGSVSTDDPRGSGDQLSNESAIYQYSAGLMESGESVSIALNDDQKRIDKARKHLVQFIQSCTGPVTKRIVALNKAYSDGTLSPVLKNAYENAWEKRRANTVLSVKTYENWCKDYEKRGHYAPLKRQKDLSVKCWHALANELRQRPQGSNISWIEEQLHKQFGDLAPKYDRLCYYFREVASQGDLLAGRYTGSQLRALKFYNHRTSEDLAPATLVHADGWNTHFSAPHPVTGEFVTYEVWHFHDVATRYVTKPGIGLTENAGVIAKGLEHYVRELGIPAVIQTDSTKVVKGNDKFTKAIESFEERLGTTWTHPQQVGNSQANGIAENFNTSYLDKRARELATYQNKNSMDDWTFKRVRKLTAAMVKAASKQDLVERDRLKKEIQKTGKGYVFDSYGDACDLINRWFDEYNDQPHSTLPKITDPATGKKRNQTPREALQWHKDHGWQGFMLDEQGIIDAFRPHVIKKVTRDTVTPWGGMRYANHEVLPHWNGKEVMVAFDTDDNSRVWVKDLKGLLLCEAKLVNAVPYLSPNFQQMAEEKRLKQQLKLLDQKRETKLERHGGSIMEGETLIKLPHLPAETLEPIELKRVEYDSENVSVEPLKVLVVDMEDKPEGQPLSYLETIKKFQTDGQ